VTTTTAAGTCSADDGVPTVTVTVPASAIVGTADALVDVIVITSAAATQNSRLQIPIPTPLTAGEVVTVSGAANTYMTSCTVGGVVSAVGASS
jgi:hypothetical protein